ncbi:helix-turn-helix domain-containing protein [Variovorax sp. V116]|uniref:helix-turn-helix domain-containing protein n=1 Tax=Variovorax sp. V116 TaxID=3065953 RepID=UPI0034E8D6E7
MTSTKNKPQGRGNGSRAAIEKGMQADGSAVLASKSTATEQQRARILEALRSRPQSTEDLRRLGIYQAPARVKELRDLFGYSIETHRVTLVDRDGFTHSRAALYRLRSEPEGVA